MNITENLKQYLETTPPEKIQSDWDKTEQFDKVGISVEEFLKQSETEKKAINEKRNERNFKNR